MNTQLATNGGNISSQAVSQSSLQASSRYATYATALMSLHAVKNGSAVLVADGTYLKSEKTNLDHLEPIAKPIAPSKEVYSDGGGI